MRPHTACSYNFKKRVTGKTLILMASMLYLVGCTSQPSIYADKSTPNQRDIEATGAAATEAARSNSSRNTDISIESNVPLPQGTQFSRDGAIDYSQFPGVCCAYYPDGTRNYKREHEIYVNKQHAKQQRERNSTYRGYASQRASSEFDWRMRRKIDDEIRRLMKSIF